MQLNVVPTAAGTLAGQATVVARPWASSEERICETTAAVLRVVRGAGACCGGRGVAIRRGVADGLGSAEGDALARDVGVAVGGGVGEGVGVTVWPTVFGATRSSLPSVPTHDRSPKTPPASTSTVTTSHGSTLRAPLTTQPSPDFGVDLQE